MKKTHLIVSIFALLIMLANPSYGFSWMAPIQVSQGVSNLLPYAALNANGHMEIVWVNGEFPNLYIHSSTFNNNSWSQPVDVSGLGCHSNPKVALDSVGNAFLVWEKFLNGRYSYVYSCKPVNGTWSAPQEIWSSQTHANTVLAMNETDQLIIGFQNGNQIVLVSMILNQNWTNETVISNLSDTKDYLGLTINPIGIGTAIWKEVDASQIYLTYTSDLVDWSSPFPLTTFCSSPKICSNNSNYCLTACLKVDSNEILATWLSEGKQLSNPLVISPKNCDSDLCVAAFGLHGFVSWINKTTSTIQAANYHLDQWITTPFDLSASAQVTSPSVSVDNTNTATITWINNESHSIEAVRFLSGGNPESIQTLSSQAMQFEDLSTVSAGPMTLVSWCGIDKGNTAIYATFNPDAQR